jgi:hypothetical protein
MHSDLPTFIYILETVRADGEESLMKLVEWQDERQMTPFHLSIKYKRLEFCQILFDLG